MENEKPSVHVVARNRKARHDYEIVSTIEAGIELRGAEVKSLREGKLNMADAHAIWRNGEIIMRNLHISPYKMATHEKLDPLRERRLLLHKREIARLRAKIEQKGMSLIPLEVYFLGSRVKIELGLGVGRKKYDKRQVIAKDEAARRIQRAKRKDLDD
ncbi:MAG: SsrA-binding protein SmpB [candidate division Zixibacteria bacterium]|nr:SsrA-binding protein SmpB [candidate division Zixibacteria bacterium]